MVLTLLGGLGGLAAARLPAESDPPELVTDRPDQTESAEIVPPGSVQIELGWLRAENEGAHELELTEAPGTLVRIGVLRRFELRAAWAGHVTLEERSARARERSAGEADVELGAKLLLSEERGARPRLALLGHLSLPTGDHPFGSPRPDPALRLTAAHTLSSRAGLGWNLGFETVSSKLADGQVRTLTRWIYTAVLGFDLSQRWGLYVELFGDLPASDRERAAHSLDAGFTFLLTPAVQLDLSVGAGLAGGAPDQFFGFGLSFRLPR